MTGTVHRFATTFCLLMSFLPALLLALSFSRVRDQLSDARLSEDSVFRRLNVLIITLGLTLYVIHLQCVLPAVCTRRRRRHQKNVGEICGRQMTASLNRRLLGRRNRRTTGFPVGDIFRVWRGHTHTHTHVRESRVRQVS